MAAKGLKITMEVPGTKLVRARLRSLPPIARQQLRKSIERHGNRIVRAAQKLVPTDTMVLYDSIRLVLDADGLGGIVVAEAPYAEMVEFGTKPHPAAKGKGSRKMPPPGVLIGWMERHGMDPKNEFALRRSIQMKGTAPQPFLFPAYEQNKDKFIEDYRQKAGRAMKRAAKGGGKKAGDTFTFPLPF